MEQKARAVLLTSNGLRHRFAAAKLGKSLNLVGIVSEVKAPLIAAPELLSQGDQGTIDQHFAERDRVEHRLLGPAASFPDTELLAIPNGAINRPGTFDWVRQRSPDVVVVFGTSLIKPPLLDFYTGRMVNIHLGLSPYYRGAGTNFWPLVNREPECVGATIHLVVAKVDAGGILAQVRPEAEICDRAHELGTKTIMITLDVMPRVLSLHVQGKIAPQPQDLSQGQVFRLKDFNAEAVRTMWRNFESGMMTEYLTSAESRCRRYPIAELPKHFE